MHRSLLLVFLAALAACSRDTAPPPAAHRAVSAVTPAQAELGGATVNLSKQVGEWLRPDAARRITADTIFDYMDGAGELYLAYRFDHLDVFEYKAADPSAGTILVELYSMKTPDDAFGLLSNDWGGDAAPMEGVTSPGWPVAVPQRATLYGGGLLRMATGNRYVRVLAARETPASREAVLTIGREILTPPGPPPTAVKGVSPPPSAPGGMPPPPLLTPPLLTRAGCKEGVDGSVIRPERTCFFRSHLVLNSQYFLASEDILGLGLDVDAVTFEYRPALPGERPERVVLIRYPSPDRAGAGLARFVRAYLPDAGRTERNAANGAAKTEHGWVAWSQKARDLVIVLDARDAAAARQLAACTLAAVPAPNAGFAN